MVDRGSGNTSYNLGFFEEKYKLKIYGGVGGILIKEKKQSCC